jgi:hypothetical protein
VYVNLLEVLQVLYLGQVLILALDGLHSGGVLLLTKWRLLRSVLCTVEFGQKHSLWSKIVYNLGLDQF